MIYEKLDVRVKMIRLLMVELDAEKLNLETIYKQMRNNFDEIDEDLEFTICKILGIKEENSYICSVEILDIEK